MAFQSKPFPFNPDTLQKFTSSIIISINTDCYFNKNSLTGWWNQEDEVVDWLKGDSGDKRVDWHVKVLYDFENCGNRPTHFELNIVYHKNGEFVKEKYYRYSNDMRFDGEFEDLSRKNNRKIGG